MDSHFATRLIRQESASRGTGTFYFEKPLGFEFTAGQFVEVTLAISGVPDNDRVHCFSISSAPFEDHIAITTRLRDSPFKRALRRLTPGGAVDVDGPYGRFVVSQNTARPVAFLVGGVGITPAFSIIKQAARNSELTAIYLFYSNRNQEETPFLGQLTRLQTDHPEFHLIVTMTDELSWNGEKERIGPEMIRRYVDPLNTSFYTSGPPAMVTAMRDMLAANGVRPDRVLFEEFSGY